jgi:tetratricopeptide (TPR) repeat protein
MAAVEMDLMRRNSRWLKIGVAGLFVGALLGGVVALFLFYNQGELRHLRTGESAYLAGLAAVKENQPQTASLRFHEAILSAENVLQAMQGHSGEGMPQAEYEKAQRMLGQAYWLKHRALKARAFTKLLIDGSPLPAFEGQAEGTPDVVLTKLSVLRVPDDPVRREALACLREAAYRLPTQADVLRDAVATEVQVEPLQWNFIHAFATTLLELDPQDERARYLAARLEYEQPIAAQTGAGEVTAPMPAAKRSRERMLKGLEHLAKLRASEQPARWRTSYLEAQIHAWLANYYRQPAQNKIEQELDELQKLRTVLFDPQTGAVARAAQEKQMSKMSRLDLQGLYGLLQMALELTLEDGRRNRDGAAGSPALLAEAVQKMMDRSVEVAARSASKERTVEAADFLVQAALKAMPALAGTRGHVWEGYRDQALELARQARGQPNMGAAFCLRVADLLTRESQRQQMEQAGPQVAALRQEAAGWLEQGLQEAAKQPAAALAMHEAKLRLAMLSGGGRAAMQDSLKALRDSGQEPYQAVAAFYEGVAAEKEGRLEASRQLLEQAWKQGRGDLSRRALTILAPMYLVLNQPESALRALDEMDRLLARLAPEERSWLNQLVRGPVDVAVLRVQGHVQAAESARQRATMAQGAAEKELAAAAGRHEAEAQNWLEKVPSSTAAGAQARVVWIGYLLHREKLQEADEQLSLLKRSHPQLLETVQLEVDLLVILGERAKAAGEPTAPGMLPPSTLVKADAAIQEYLKRPGANPAGRLMWLKWLAHTGRKAVAERTLADPAFFADASGDPRIERIKALAHLYCGQKGSAQPLLEALPDDPQLDVALLQAAATAAEQQQVLNSAIRNYTDAGLFRAWSAALSLARGDHAEAFRGFVSCMEFTRVRPLVRQGISQALINMSQQNPQEARRLAADALQHYPSEPSLLLGYAFASLQLGEVGSPAEGGEQVRDMSTALRAYDAACRLDREPFAGPWVSAQLWLLAQRPDVARAEAARALEIQAKHEGALRLAIRLSLEQPDPAALVQAQQYAATLRMIPGQEADGLYWQGRVLRRAGKLNEALACYRELMQKHSRYGPGYAECVDLMLESRKAEAAMEIAALMKQWHQAMPNDPRLWQFQVRMAARQGNLDEARQFLQQRLAQVEMAAANAQPIQPVSASGEAGQTPRLPTQTAWAEQTGMLSLGLVQEGRLDEALEWLGRCLQKNPDHEPSLLLMGEVYLKQMNVAPVSSDQRRQLAAQAAKAYRKVYAGRKGHPVAGNNLAWILAVELNDPAEADRIGQELRRGRFMTRPMPGDRLPADLLDTLGVVYEKLGQSGRENERVELFEAARRRYPQDARIFVHLGNSYLDAKDGRRAAQVFATARTLLEKSAGLAAERRNSLREEIERGQARAKALAKNSGPG